MTYSEAVAKAAFGSRMTRPGYGANAYIFVKDNSLWLMRPGFSAAIPYKPNITDIRSKQWTLFT